MKGAQLVSLGATLTESELVGIRKGCPERSSPSPTTRTAPVAANAGTACARAWLIRRSCRPAAGAAAAIVLRKERRRITPLSDQMWGGKSRLKHRGERFVRASSKVTLHRSSSTATPYFSRSTLDTLAPFSRSVIAAGSATCFVSVEWLISTS